MTCLLIADSGKCLLQHVGFNSCTRLSNFFVFSLLLLNIGISFPGQANLAALATLFRLTNRISYYYTLYNVLNIVRIFREEKIFTYFNYNIMVQRKVEGVLQTYANK